jgi:N-dimethylarginine dimethylaminohydrolase
MGIADTQHRRLVDALDRSGIEVISLPEGEGLSLDAAYAHDASLVTDHGAICLRMGKTARTGEPARHAELYRGLDIPILGIMQPPATAEAGDIVWLDEATLLVGRGYRTNDAGIETLNRWLGPKGIEVIVATLPHGPGPSACLHLMSLMSLLDERTVLVDLAWLSVPTVELLQQRQFRLIEIVNSERDTMACNVLSLGSRRLLALEENSETNARLREHGFEVETFPSSEICQNGSGGPTCLTRPILREGG